MKEPLDDKRVLLDKGLPEIKHDWASAHEAGHEIIPWHREFCRGDTLLTLDPAWQEQIEAEANYAASGLLFCGDVFAALRGGGVGPWGSFNCGLTTDEENRTLSMWNVFTTGIML